LVVTVRENPVSGFTNLTVAPGTAAPFWSVTVPLTPDVPTWAEIFPIKKAEIIIVVKVRKTFVFKMLKFIAPPRF
jgi:hypothetical protein